MNSFVPTAEYATEPDLSGFDWSPDDYAAFSLKTQLLPHHYHESPLFSSEALEQLLDEYPREWLQCYTMGTDPENNAEWTAVHIADLSGREILDVLQKSRIWINAVKIDQYTSDYSDLIRSMYQKIEHHCPNLNQVKTSFSALILSSPGIQVYYHLDPDPNMLWHLKGRKRVWVYPAHDTRFTPQNYVEEIVGEERDENMPYHRWFDDYATYFELKPGDLVSWPQHSPHRVENIDFNVSLTTSYGSRQSRRLNGVHGANHFLLKPFNITQRSTNTQGLIPAAKAFSYYALNRLGLLKKGQRALTYVSDIKADPTSESGLSRIDRPIRTAFSYVDET